MSYRGLNTKYGNQTTSFIAGLTGMVEGDTVFNTDYGMVEWYTGQVWTNSCSVLMTASATLAEGQCVVINASGQAALLVYTSSAVTPYAAIGVVQYGGTIGQTVSIRTHGIAKCRTSAAGGLTIGQYAAISSGTIGARRRIRDLISAISALKSITDCRVRGLGASSFESAWSSTSPK
jgi:hypothetical protein